MSEKTHEEVWNDFWASIVVNDDGTLNMDQLKRELAEWHHAMHQVSLVYSHITDDLWSKPTYYAKDIIQAAEDYTRQRIEWAIADFLHDNDLPQSLLYGDHTDGEVQ